MAFSLTKLYLSPCSYVAINCAFRPKGSAGIGPQRVTGATGNGPGIENAAGVGSSGLFGWPFEVRSQRMMNGRRLIENLKFYRYQHD